VRDDLWTSLELTGGVTVDVRPTGGRTRGGGRVLSKLNRFLNRPMAMTET